MRVPCRLACGGAVALLLATASPRAADAGRVVGRVLAPGDQPVAGARVTVLEARRRAVSLADGTFAFDGLPPGTWTLEAESARAGSGVSQVTLDPGAVEARVDIRLDLLQLHESVVVSASPDVRGRDALYQAASVLDGNELARQVAPTIGETLAQQPGVHATWFGPGASRPVIRGLGGDRVRIMSNGVEAGDASSTSPDHAVSLGPLTAERVEVIRGPATLMYGSNAVGGIVNVLDNRVPAIRAEEPVTGTAQIGAASADDSANGSLVLDGGRRAAAWHLDGFRSRSGDVATPIGRLENTRAESDGMAGGLSWVGERGFVGAAFGAFHSRYGSAAEPDVTIDLEQRRWDLDGELRQLGRAFKSLRWRAGSTGYEHVELEGDEVGTRFLNDSWEARVQLVHEPAGRFTGSFGLQHSSRDFAAIGDESFVPATSTRTTGVFLFEEGDFGKWRLQLGGRWDARTVACGDCATRSRDLDGVSASMGVLRSWSGWSLSASLTRAVKLPNAEELFSNGPHLATRAFERGDPGLGPETSHGLDLGLRHHGEGWHLDVDVFHYAFEGFIRESATGEVEDGLPVFRFAQAGARLWGGEATASVELHHVEPRHVRLELGVDVVRSEQGGGGSLPRMPPARARLGVRYQGPLFWTLIQGTWVAEQRDVDVLETRTDGYTTLDAWFGWRILGRTAVQDVILAGRNVTDELARDHVSFLKDVAPLPGASASLTWRILF